MRIIIEYAEGGDCVGQVHAALAAIKYYASGAGGTFLGMRIDGKFYGVKRNKGSLHVYPQKENIE